MSACATSLLQCWSSGCWQRVQFISSSRIDVARNAPEPGLFDLVGHFIWRWKEVLLRVNAQRCDGILNLLEGVFQGQTLYVDHVFQYRVRQVLIRVPLRRLIENRHQVQTILSR